MPILPKGRFCPPQTILLVGCINPLQIVMVVWHLFYFILRAPTSHYYLQRSVTPSLRTAKGRQTTITICRGLSIFYKTFCKY